ncbi:hypothetical protein [Rubinisphaera sp. JC750]|uniref:hypothetical protein n=1 Tax=Rubinisphaera sp. JC750 TaxID=2898658 RepID=UPI001F176DA3|nr:hypothetical protein [Rubinisphaera sp. JC750]
MTSYICTHGEHGHMRLHPLSTEHGVAHLPENVGAFSTDRGQRIEIRRNPTGPASYSHGSEAAHVQQQIRGIVENGFWASANPAVTVDQPLVLANGKIHLASRVDALLRVTLKSLAEHADFSAHISILNALYHFLGVQSDVAELSKVASTMGIETGMCLPVTDGAGNTSVMKVLSSAKELSCYHVSFYSPSEYAEPFQAEHPIGRVATWKERGSDEEQVVKSLIGELV